MQACALEKIAGTREAVISRLMPRLQKRDDGIKRAIRGLRNASRWTHGKVLRPVHSHISCS
jgi:hypothetical protein